MRSRTTHLLLAGLAPALLLHGLAAQELAGSETALLWPPVQGAGSRASTPLALTPLQDLFGEGQVDSTADRGTDLTADGFAHLLEQALEADPSGETRVEVVAGGRVWIRGTRERIAAARALAAWLDARLLASIDVELDVLHVTRGSLDDAPYGALEPERVASWVATLEERGAIVARRGLSGRADESRCLALGGREQEGFLANLEVELACGGVLFEPWTAHYGLGTDARLALLRSARGHHVHVAFRTDAAAAPLRGPVGAHRRTQEGHRGPFHVSDVRLDLERPSVDFARLAWHAFLPREQTHVTLLRGGEEGRATDLALLLRVRDDGPPKPLDVASRRVAWCALPRHAAEDALVGREGFGRLHHEAEPAHWQLPPALRPSDLPASLSFADVPNLVVEELAGGLLFVGSADDVERALARWNRHLESLEAGRRLDVALTGGRGQRLALATETAGDSPLVLAAGRQHWMRLDGYTEIGCSTEAILTETGPWVDGLLARISPLAPTSPGRPPRLALDGVVHWSTRAPREIAATGDYPIVLDGTRYLVAPLHAVLAVRPGESVAFGRDPATPGPFPAGTVRLD